MPNFGRFPAVIDQRKDGDPFCLQGGLQFVQCLVQRRVAGDANDSSAGHADPPAYNKTGNRRQKNRVFLIEMIKFLLWCLLFIFCWPLALLALVLYPLVWLLLLPFRIAGIAVEGALQLVTALITLPARLLRAI